MEASVAASAKTFSSDYQSAWNTTADIDGTDIGDDQHLSGDRIRRLTLDRSRLKHTCQVDTTSNDVSEIMDYRHWLILKLVFESPQIVR